jgi:CBS domain containing-hemolysin-like protein
VCRGSLDQVVGVGRATELLAALVTQGRIDEQGAHIRMPLYLPESASVTHTIDVLRRAKGQLVLVNDEYGLLKGLLTPFDVLEAIAGEFPDEDELPEIERLEAGVWRVAGTADIHQLQRMLETEGLVSDDDSYTSLAGYLLSRLGRMPSTGEVLIHDGWQMQVLDVDGQRIRAVRIEPASDETRAQAPSA